MSAQRDKTGPARRVLLVSHYFPPHVGGIENVVEGEAIHLAKAGHEVTVLTTAAGAGAGFGAGFGMRSGSHSAIARAGVHWLVRTHTPAPMARTTPPCVSVR